METYTNKYDILGDLNTYGSVKGYWAGRFIEIDFDAVCNEAWMCVGDDEMMFSNQYELLDALEYMEEEEGE